MRHWTRFRLIGLLAAVAFPALVASPAQAQGESNAVCSFVWKAYFSPGFTMTKGTGIYGTGVEMTGTETGLMTCAGMINGHWVTGPGTFGHKGKTWDGSCFGNQGAGTYSYTIPTAGGVQHVTGTYTESRGINHEGPVEARQPGAVFYGRHQVFPTGITSPNTTRPGGLTDWAGVARGLTTGLFAKIRRDFPDDHQRVVGQLDAVVSGNQDRERVLAAVVAIANGDFDRLQKAVELST